MSTRGLVVVVNDNEVKLAQYNGYDSYYSALGTDLIMFIRSFNKEQFCKNLDIVHMNGSYDNNTYDAINILNDIHNANDKRFAVINTNDSLSFAADSLFCEYAYVIDLDNDILEVYTGFNKEAIPETNRFFTKNCNDEVYKPVKLVSKIPFKELGHVTQMTNELINKFA